MVARSNPLTLPDALERCLSLSLNIEDAAAEQYRISMRLFERWAASQANRPLELSALHEDHIVLFLRWYKSQGVAARTVNNKRQALLTAWQWAADRGWIRRPDVRSVPRLREPKRNPTAWSPEQVGKLLLSCDAARRIPGWSPDHWRALVLTIYDTSTRIGALLQTPRSQLDGPVLIVPAEIQKQSSDTIHTLHPQTVGLIGSLPDADLLFPWPLHRRAIWTEFKVILKAAGLPTTRRDLFHRLRRTSYTWVWIAAGPEAATRHAGHSRSLEQCYLDRTKIPGRPACDLLPRPI